MKPSEINRLRNLEKVIRRIVEEEGLATTDIIFEIASSQMILEGMAYMFPVNFHHWTFGRDYEKYRTIYEYTGRGIPYEQVWNFDPPKAFLLETNPFAINAMVMAHVFGHVDFFLKNVNTSRAHDLTDVAEEARTAAARFYEYEKRYGEVEVEKVIDAGMSIMWHQHPDPFFEEESEDIVRERLIAFERAKLEGALRGEVRPEKIKSLREEAQKRIDKILSATPPEPVYDILRYIIKHSPVLKRWMRDVLEVIRRQARVLAPNIRTKMLNEGWATYWHLHIMRRLAEEGYITKEEHGVFNRYHSRLVRPSKKTFNWYGLGLALFEDIEERWNKGRFGKEYEECKDLQKRLNWDNNLGKGREKIFEVRELYSDRMAVEEFFTDEFIKEQKLYIFVEQERNDFVYDVIAEIRPDVIRKVLKSFFTFHGIPLITVENGNFGGSGDLYLKHHPTGFELDPEYRDGTLEHIYFLWRSKVYLETVVDGDPKLFGYNGKTHSTKDLSSRSS